MFIQKYANYYITNPFSSIPLKNQKLRNEPIFIVPTIYERIYPASGIWHPVSGCMCFSQSHFTVVQWPLLHYVKRFYVCYLKNFNFQVEYRETADEYQIPGRG
jgi:hypothetical protein